LLTILAVPVDALGAATAPERAVVTAVTPSSMYGLTAAGNSVWLNYERLSPELGDVQRVYTRELKDDPAGPRRRSARN
jgi:hypothetical protein